MQIIGIIIIGLAFAFFSGFRVVKEYERGIVYTLGKYSGMRTAG